MDKKPEEMTASQAYMIVAATLAAAWAASMGDGEPIEVIYNQYVRVYQRVWRKGVNPEPIAAGGKL